MNAEDMSQAGSRILQSVREASSYAPNETTGGFVAHEGASSYAEMLNTIEELGKIVKEFDKIVKQKDAEITRLNEDCNQLCQAMKQLAYKSNWGNTVPADWIFTHVKEAISE